MSKLSKVFFVGLVIILVKTIICTAGEELV